MSVTIYYRAPKDAPEQVAELRGDPFEVCRRVAARLGLETLEPDPAFERVMAARKARPPLPA